jgi:hypothetical protein
MKYFDRVRLAILAAAVIVPGGAAPLSAETRDKPRPELFQKLVDCKSIADGNARLACYDEQVEKLDQAERRKEVFLVDKKQVQKTRRTLFGLPLPNLGLFGGGDKDEANEENQLTELEAVIKSVSYNGEGWLITIDEGSTWQQMDGAVLALSPKPGMPVLIKRAALGSYKMSIRKQPSIRVKRVI